MLWNVLSAPYLLINYIKISRYSHVSLTIHFEINKTTMSAAADDLEIITFRELQELSDEDLALCVSKHAAIEICRFIMHKSIQSFETTISEIFSWWLRHLNKSYKVEDFSAKEWQQLIELFIELVQEDLKDVISDILELQAWFCPLQNRLGVEKSCIILRFLLQVVLRFIRFYTDDPTAYNALEFLKQTLLLFTLVLKALNENMDMYKLSNTAEYIKLTEVQTILYVIAKIIAEDVPRSNLKTNIESWKCITKLTIQCAKFKNTTNNEGIPNIAGVACRPLVFFLREIKRNLYIIYKEEILQQPVEQVEKYLRITNLYLKLLQRLTDEFPHESFPCISEFVDTFVTAKTPPSFLSNSKLACILEKYVLQDLCQVFNMIYKNQEIIKRISSETSLCESDVNKKSKEFYIMAKAFVRATIRDKQEIFIKDNIYLFARIFQCFVKVVKNFCDNDVYNEMLELFAALVILNHTPELKRHFRFAIFKGDFILAHASMDVLLTVARTRHTSSDELLQNFRYWRKCNEIFSLFTNNPRELQVVQKLLHYYRLCQSKGLISKSELFNASSTENAQVLSSACKLFKALPETCDVDVTELEKALENYEVLQSIDNYYEMLIKIKCLSSNDVIRNENISGKSLNSILNIMMNIMNASPVGFFKPLGVFELAAKYFTQLDEETILSILRIFKQHAASRSTHLMPSAFTFLQAAQSKSQKLKEYAAELLVEVANQSHPKPLQCLFIFKKLENIENYKMSADLCKQLILKPFDMHNCKPRFTYKGPPAKRLRSEEHGVLTRVLNDMLDKSGELLAADAKLDAHDLDLLKRIQVNLSNVHSKQTKSS